MEDYILQPRYQDEEKNEITHAEIKKIEQKKNTPSKLNTLA